MGVVMLDTYNARLAELKLTNIGKWNTSRGSDPTPYSGDSNNLEESAVSKLENEFGKTRYQLGEIGGGSQNAAGYTASKTWSDTTPKK
jgi:hypothetical protein